MRHLMLLVALVLSLVAQANLAAGTGLFFYQPEVPKNLR